MMDVEDFCACLIALHAHERTPCEIWTRVMGFHRPVHAFNAGKCSEHRERRHFLEPGRPGPAVRARRPTPPMLTITVNHCPQSKHGPYHLIYGLALWPRGTVKNRGWANARTLYERDAHPIENEEQRTAYRYLCWQYRTWDALVADEARYGVDACLCRDTWTGERIALAACRTTNEEHPCP